MRRFVLLLVVVFMVVPVPCFAASGAKQVATIRLISRVEVMKSKDVQGLFEGLTAEASKLGLVEATVHGTMAYERLPNKAVRVKVQWHSLGVSKGGATESLGSPLWSQFTVKDKKIEPGTQVKAKGDLEGVATTFLALKEKAKSDTPRHLVDSKETSSTSNTTKLADNGIAPSGSSTGTSAGSSEPSGSSSDNTTVSTDLITTSWESCQPRIDADNGLLYLQWRRTEKNEDGTIIDQGACLDTGETVAGSRDYSSCAVFIDYANMKVFEKYVLAGLVDGVDYPILDCTIDPDRFFDIQATQDQCGMRHDFTAGQSIEQERLIYLDAAGQVNDVSSCQDSTVAYAHFLTEQTCTPTIDKMANVVFINKRTAYRLNDGTMEFANDCRPVDQAGTPIHEEYCTPKYEHDFINNVSYYSTRDYYLDEFGAAQYLTACSRSSTASFSHLFETTGCGVSNNDQLLQTTFQAKIQIDTTDDGIIEISPCQDNGAPTSYAFLRSDSIVQNPLSTNLQAGTYAYNIATGGTQVAVAANANTDYTIAGLSRAGIDWGNMNTSLSVSANGPITQVVDSEGGTTWAPDYSTKAWFVNGSNGHYRTPGSISNETTSWRAAYHPTIGIAFGRTWWKGVEAVSKETTLHKVYLRGDGTEFWREDGSQVIFILKGIPQ